MSTIDLLETTPLPSWLSPETEIKHSDQPESYKSLEDRKKAVAFVLLSFKALKTIPTLTDKHILWITANAVSETGWGRSWKGWNFGGWKINQQVVKDWRQTNPLDKNKCPPWWKALGHVASGDTPVVYYQGFLSPQDFYSKWVTRFVPATATSTHRYYETGKKFWANNQGWFRELCLAGYKGPVTQASPDASCHAFDEICLRVMCIFCQHLLGLTPDGSWGPASTLAAKNWQKQQGFEASTGTLTPTLFSSLLHDWWRGGMKQIVDLPL